MNFLENSVMARLSGLSILHLIPTTYLLQYSRINQMHPTLLDALMIFCTSHPKEASKARSAVKRYLLPALGLNYSDLSARITKNNIKEANNFMTEYYLNNFNKAELLSLLEDEFKKQKLSTRQKNSPRSLISQFLNSIDLSDSPESILANNIQNTPTNSKRCEVLFNQRLVEAEKKKNRKRRAVAITLSLDAETYLDTYMKANPDKPRCELLKDIKKELHRIYDELEKCANFLATKETNPCNQRTIKGWFEKIYHILGWSYQTTGKLSEVGLNQIIPIVNTNYLDEDYIDDLQKEAAKAGKQVIKTLKDFFEYNEKNYQENSEVDINDPLSSEKLVKQTKRNNKIVEKGYRSSTKATYIKCLIQVAKYLYRDITDEAFDYSDIPIIECLRVERKKLPKDTNKVQTIPVTYLELKEILKRLKDEADATYSRSKRKIKRSDKTIAKDIQRFIAMGFLVILPPLRARTLSELELGNTLKYGYFSDNGRFTPHNELAEGQSKYYYDFDSEDYKTGKTYGEYRAEIPNVTFEDGTTFYTYLNKWFFEGWREKLLNNQSHSYVFLSPQGSQKSLAGEPLSSVAFSHLIGALTYRYTECHVYPHKFRHIRRSHEKERGATPQELESLAFWMQHSEEIAEKTYTIIDVKNKLMPCQKFLENEKF